MGSHGLLCALQRSCRAAQLFFGRAYLRGRNARLRPRSPLSLAHRQHAEVGVVELTQALVDYLSRFPGDVPSLPLAERFSTVRYISRSGCDHSATANCGPTY